MGIGGKVEIKFKKNYKEYQYICCFDIATHCGCSVYSIKEDKFIYWEEIYLGNHLDEPNYFYSQLERFFAELFQKYQIDKKDILVIKERYILQMMGGRTNIKTIINLIKWQTIFDLFLSINDFDVYDFIGLSVPTCKAYYRRIMNQKDINKLDIQNFVCNKYNIQIGEEMTDNISDSMSLILPFFYKWNIDIDDEIKQTKKEIKTLKQNSAIKHKNDYIEFLVSLKNE